MGILTKDETFLPSINEKQQSIMLESVNGFWAQDLCMYKESPYYSSETSRARSKLDFTTIKSHHLRLEFRYFISYSIEIGVIKPTTFFNQYGCAFKRFISFINEVNIIKDLLMEKSKTEILFFYRTWLIENNHSIQRKVRKSQNTVSADISFFNTMYNFYYDFYDDREEVEKDIWDFEKLGIDYNEAATKRCIDFTGINEPWKRFVKRYVHERCVVMQDIKNSTGVLTVIRLTYFFNWFTKINPEWIDLRELRRKHILEFVHHLRTSPMGGTMYSKPATDKHVKTTVLCLSVFLEYIQFHEWDIAPITDCKRLITSAEKPDSYKKRIEEKANKVDYIPDEVWEQLVQHIDKLMPVYKIMALTLEESGFRITDICSLKLDCVVYDSSGYWLKGDQRKVNKKNHLVPITEELANVLMLQVEQIKSLSNSNNNPKGYLFPIFSGRRKGKPYSTPSIARNLNNLAINNNICDHLGTLFNFKAHQFRHRYGMTLINKGVNITVIQELMAHASPEMTSVYAKVLDTTKRKAWEGSRGSGVLRLESNGRFIPVDLESAMIENGIELEWIRQNFDALRMNHGICVKSPKLPCSFLEDVIEPPCIKNSCRSFHVDNTFLDFYQSEINKMTEDIELLMKKGRIRSIELTERRLASYRKILNEINENGGIFGLPKDKREFVNAEREGGN